MASPTSARDSARLTARSSVPTAGSSLRRPSSAVESSSRTGSWASVLGPGSLTARGSLTLRDKPQAKSLIEPSHPVFWSTPLDPGECLELAMHRHALQKAAGASTAAEAGEAHTASAGSIHSPNPHRRSAPSMPPRPAVAGTGQPKQHGPLTFVNRERYGALRRRIAEAGAVRVYLCCDFDEFREEREALRRESARLRRLCEDRGVSFDWVDMRWGLTGEESRQPEMLVRCLDEVERAAPFFVGLLGNRYGETAAPGLEGYDSPVRAAFDAAVRDPRFAYLDGEMRRWSLAACEVYHALERAGASPQEEEDGDGALFPLHAPWNLPECKGIYYRDPALSAEVARREGLAAEPEDSHRRLHFLKRKWVPVKAETYPGLRVRWSPDAGYRSVSELVARVLRDLEDLLSKVLYPVEEAVPRLAERVALIAESRHAAIVAAGLQRHEALVKTTLAARWFAWAREEDPRPSPSSTPPTPATPPAPLSASWGAWRAPRHRPPPPPAPLSAFEKNARHESALAEAGGRVQRLAAAFRRARSNAIVLVLDGAAALLDEEERPLGAVLHAVLRPLFAAGERAVRVLVTVPAGAATDLDEAALSGENPLAPAATRSASRAAAHRLRRAAAPRVARGAPARARRPRGAPPERPPRPPRPPRPRARAASPPSSASSSSAPSPPASRRPRRPARGLLLPVAAGGASPRPRPASPLPVAPGSSLHALVSLDGRRAALALDLPLGELAEKYLAWGDRERSSAASAARPAEAYFRFIEGATRERSPLRALECARLLLLPYGRAQGGGWSDAPALGSGDAAALRRADLAALTGRGRRPSGAPRGSTTPACPRAPRGRRRPLRGTRARAPVPHGPLVALVQTVLAMLYVEEAAALRRRARGAGALAEPLSRLASLLARFKPWSGLGLATPPRGRRASPARPPAPPERRQRAAQVRVLLDSSDGGDADGRGRREAAAEAARGRLQIALAGHAAELAPSLVGGESLSALAEATVASALDRAARELGSSKPAEVLVFAVALSSAGPSEADLLALTDWTRDEWRRVCELMGPVLERSGGRVSFTDARVAQAALDAIMDGDGTPAGRHGAAQRRVEWHKFAVRSGYASEVRRAEEESYHKAWLKRPVGCACGRCDESRIQVLGALPKRASAARHVPPDGLVGKAARFAPNLARPLVLPREQLEDRIGRLYRTGTARMRREVEMRAEEKQAAAARAAANRAYVEQLRAKK
eukprot:tig00001126_g7130.t1